MPCKAKVWVKSVIQDRNVAQCQFTITLFDTYLPKSLQGEARKHEKYKPKTEMGSKKKKFTIKVTHFVLQEVNIK